MYLAEFVVILTLSLSLSLSLFSPPPLPRFRSLCSTMTVSFSAARHCSTFHRPLATPLDTRRVWVRMFGYAKCSCASQVECLMALFCLNTDPDTTGERTVSSDLHTYPWGGGDVRLTPPPAFGVTRSFVLIGSDRLNRFLEGGGKKKKGKKREEGRNSSTDFYTGELYPPERFRSLDRLAFVSPPFLPPLPPFGKIDEALPSTKRPFVNPRYRIEASSGDKSAKPMDEAANHPLQVTVKYTS